jgi:hypothetical protein
MVYLLAETLPDDDFAIKYDSILLPFIHELHSDPVLHPSDHDSSDTEADSNNACIDPEKPPARTQIHGNSYLEYCLAGQHTE